MKHFPALSSATKHFEPSQTSEQVHLSLKGTIHFESKTFTSRALLVFRAKSLTESLKIQAKEIELQNISVAFTKPEKSYSFQVLSELKYTEIKKKLEKQEEVQATFLYTGEEICLNFEQPISENNFFVLSITYKVSSPPAGLYFIESPYPCVWSQGQDVDNPYWFPCQDSPRLKLTTELDITFPNLWQVLANGKRVATDMEGTMRRERWRVDQPHAPYLVAFVAGEFEMQEDLTASTPLYLLLHKDHYRLGPKILQDTKNMVAFYERTFHAPFPWPQYGQAFVPHFIYGGMENTGCTINTDEVLGSDSFLDQDRSYELLVVHELAHQWFGDYVTCHHWSEGWLNEGFATYGEILWEEERYGPVEALFYAKDHVLKSYQEEAHTYERPVVCRTYEFVSEIFDAHLYEKGGLVLRYLSRLMGAEVFRKGVAHYLKQHSYSTATTGDFMRRLQESSGFNPEPVFDNFIYNGTFLNLSVTLANTSPKMLEIQCEQTQATLEDKKSLLNFQAPLKVVFGDGSVQEFWLNIERVQEKRSLSFEKPIAYAVFDTDACLPGHVEQKWPEHFCLTVLQKNLCGYEAFLAVQNLCTQFPKTTHAPLLVSWMGRETSARAKVAAYTLWGEKRGPLMDELHRLLPEETSSSLARQAYVKNFLPNQVSLPNISAPSHPAVKPQDVAEKLIATAQNPQEFFRVRDAALQGLFHLVTHSTALRTPEQREVFINFAWKCLDSAGSAMSEYGILEAQALKLVGELGDVHQTQQLLNLWERNTENPWRLNVACLDALATLASRYPEIRSEIRPALVARANEMFPVRLAARLPEIWEKTKDPSYVEDFERYINRKNYGLFSILIPKARRVQKRFLNSQTTQGQLSKDQWTEFQELKKKLESLEQLVQALPKS